LNEPPIPKGTDTISMMTAAEFFPFWVVMAFIYGALIGSFLNVCILRLPLGMSVFKPKRSFCFRCGHQIPWYDNLPIISYFLLGGKDRACGSKFSPRYMLIELMTGILFAATFIMWNSPGAGNFSFMTLWYVLFISLIIIGVFTDIDHWINIDYLTRGGTVVAVVFALLAGFFDRDSLIATSGPFPFIRIEAADWVERTITIMIGGIYPWQNLPEVQWWEPVANSLIGMVFAPGLVIGISKIFELIRGQEGMGLGDAEIFAMIGATLGAQNSLLVLVFASFLGSIGGIILIIINSTKSQADWEKSPLRLGRWKPDEAELKALQLSEKTEADSDAENEEDTPLETTPEELEQAKEFAKSLNEKFINLDETEFDDEVLEAFSAKLAIEHEIIPIKKKKDHWVLAVKNPLSTTLINAIQKELKLEARFMIAAESQLIKYSEKLYGEIYDSQNEELMNGAKDSATNAELWKQYVAASQLLPREKPKNRLPFIPWIAGGTLMVLLAYPVVLTILRKIFVVDNL